MKQRLSTLVLIVVLMAALVSPVYASNGSTSDKNPYKEVGWVVEFERIKFDGSARGFGVTASGCATYILGVDGYSWAGVKIWSYAWNIHWCYNGSTVTSLSKWRTVWTNYGWSFRGDIAESESGGVGQGTYWHYAQGDFCFIETWTCVAHSYPWVDQTVSGTGLYWGNGGGN